MKQGKASPLLRRTGALRRRRLRSMSHSGSCCHDSSSSDEDLTAKTKTPVGLSPPPADVTPMSAAGQAGVRPKRRVKCWTNDMFENSSDSEVSPAAASSSSSAEVRTSTAMKSLRQLTRTPANHYQQLPATQPEDGVQPGQLEQKFDELPCTPAHDKNTAASPAVVAVIDCASAAEKSPPPLFSGRRHTAAMFPVLRELSPNTVRRSTPAPRKSPTEAPISLVNSALSKSLARSFYASSDDGCECGCQRTGTICVSTPQEREEEVVGDVQCQQAQSPLGIELHESADAISPSSPRLIEPIQKIEVAAPTPWRLPTTPSFTFGSVAGAAPTFLTSDWDSPASTAGGSVNGEQCSGLSSIHPDVGCSPVSPAMPAMSHFIPVGQRAFGAAGIPSVSGQSNMSLCSVEAVDSLGACLPSPALSLVSETSVSRSAALSLNAVGFGSAVKESGGSEEDAVVGRSLFDEQLVEEAEAELLDSQIIEDSLLLGGAVELGSHGTDSDLNGSCVVYVTEDGDGPLQKLIQEGASVADAEDSQHSSSTVDDVVGGVDSLVVAESVSSPPTKLSDALAVAALLSPDTAMLAGKDSGESTEEEAELGAGAAPSSPETVDSGTSAAEVADDLLGVALTSAWAAIEAKHEATVEEVADALAVVAVHPPETTPLTANDSSPVDVECKFEAASTASPPEAVDGKTSPASAGLTDALSGDKLVSAGAAMEDDNEASVEKLADALTVAGVLSPEATAAEEERAGSEAESFDESATAALSADGTQAVVDSGTEADCDAVGGGRMLREVGTVAETIVEGVSRKEIRLGYHDSKIPKPPSHQLKRSDFGKFDKDVEQLLESIDVEAELRTPTTIVKAHSHIDTSTRSASSAESDVHVETDVVVDARGGGRGADDGLIRLSSDTDELLELVSLLPPDAASGPSSPLVFESTVQLEGVSVTTTPVVGTERENVSENFAEALKAQTPPPTAPASKSKGHSIVSPKLVAGFLMGGVAILTLLALLFVSLSPLPLPAYVDSPLFLPATAYTPAAAKVATDRCEPFQLLLHAVWQTSSIDESTHYYVSSETSHPLNDGPVSQMTRELDALLIVGTRLLSAASDPLLEANQLLRYTEQTKRPPAIRPRPLLALHDGCVPAERLLLVAASRCAVDDTPPVVRAWEVLVSELGALVNEGSEMNHLVPVTADHDLRPTESVSSTESVVVTNGLRLLAQCGAAAALAWVARKVLPSHIRERPSSRL